MASRIYIEDAEDNFLYLNVDLPRDEIEAVVEALNRYSNGRARLEPEASAEDQELMVRDIAERKGRRPSSSSIRLAARRKRGR